MDEIFLIQPDRPGVQRLAVEKVDIDAMRGGWLTDNCIREVIARFGNFTTSRVNFVDPTWLHQWIRQDGYEREETPAFFQPHPGVPFVQGLAIPFNEGNKHWTREQNASKLMLQFYSSFREFFQGKGLNRFQFVVDQNHEWQGDGISCGIYVAAAVIDLLGMARPRTEVVTAEQIRISRENGLRWLKEAPKVWDFFLKDNAGPTPKVKKAVHWDPSIPEEVANGVI
ncbi:cysteine proteinase [Hyaloscypha variabilis]